MSEGWWILPESATKNRVAHRVPLTDRVVELLKEAKADAPEEPAWAPLNHVDRGAPAPLVYQRYEFDAEKRGSTRVPSCLASRPS